MTNRLPEQKPTGHKFIEIVVLTKGEHQWVFVYTDTTRYQMLRQLGRMAADPKLDFSWVDGTKVSDRIRQEAGPKADD